MQSSRRSQVDPFIVMDVMEAARQAEAAGRKIIHMEVGQPGTGAPLRARQAAIKALETQPLGYTVALGLPELRARIARLYGDWYDVDLDPARVIVTSGSSGAFILAFNALFDGDARVGIGSPGYPSYRQILRALGLQAVDIETAFDNGFQLTPADVKDHALDGVMVASPANPTGTMLDRPSLHALIDAAQETGAAFISDEIYHGISYGRGAETALSHGADVYVINSFSKYFSMTGWRVGWMVVPADHVRRIERLAQNLFICAPHVSQVAALAALDATDELQENLAAYRDNRDNMLRSLPAAGLPRFAPAKGAFYIYADIAQFGLDSRDFCDRLLRSEGVAATPGLDFDPARGRNWIRFSYARSRDDIEDGMNRIARFTQTL